MRKPSNRSDSSRLPTALYIQPADAAFGAHNSDQSILDVPGAKVGHCVLCTQVDSGVNLVSGIVFQAKVFAPNVVEVICQNVTAAPINLQQTTIRVMVLPY